MTNKELFIHCVEKRGGIFLEREKRQIIEALEILEIIKKGIENAGYIKIFSFNADKLEIHEITKVRNWINGKDD